MSTTRCAACNEDLGANPITLKIRGTAVQVCSDECAATLKRQKER